MQWPKASVLPTFVIDEDLWAQVCGDWFCYVEELRKQGRLMPQDVPESVYDLARELTGTGVRSEVSSPATMSL